MEQKLKNREYLALEFQKQEYFLSGKPFDLTIETGAICPLQCPFCEQNFNDFDLSREFLSLDNYKKVIDQLAGTLQHINLFNWGEPLLNPALPDMIKYATHQKMETVVHTSLNFLSENCAENLLQSQLTQLIISLDGASEESYPLYRKKGSFSNVIKNLDLFLRKKKEFPQSSCDVIWKFLVFRHNEHEMKTAQQMAQERGIPIKFSFAVASGEFVSTREEFNNKNNIIKYKKNYDAPCDQLWKGPVIHSNGDVFPCCLIYQKKYAVGNIFKQKFENIWNNEEYQKMRQVTTGKKFADNSLFCKDCRFNPRNQTIQPDV